MRILQIILFGMAVAAILTASFFIGTDDGDTFWKIGLTLLLLDMVCIKLWPTLPKQSKTVNK
jgi:hypothetical protein